MFVFECITDDLWIIILQDCDVKSILSFGAISKKCYKLSRNEMLWKHKYDVEFMIDVMEVGEFYPLPKILRNTNTCYKKFKRSSLMQEIQRENFWKSRKRRSRDVRRYSMRYPCEPNWKTELRIQEDKMINKEKNVLKVIQRLCNQSKERYDGIKSLNGNLYFTKRRVKRALKRCKCVTRDIKNLIKLLNLEERKKLTTFGYLETYEQYVQEMEKQIK